MFSTKKPAAPATQRVREFTYFYGTQFHTFYAENAADALRQVRANLSAKAEREAVLTSVK